MKNINLYFGKFHLGLGWFKNEPFKLLNIRVLDITNYAWKTIFGFQIGKFCFDFSWVA